MNKEYFTDNISVETMAELIDETLRLEKNNKKDRFKNMNIIYKIVPAVAAVALIFGAVNSPVFKNLNNTADSDANAYISTIEINTGSLTASITSNNQINTADDMTDNNTEKIKHLKVNINPKDLSKWKSFTGSSSTADNTNAYINNLVIDGVTINSGVYKADGIEIYFTNGIVVKTHDTVKVDENKIIIAGNTFIDGNGNIIEEGKGKFTITDKNGIETAVNGGNQSRYTGANPDGDANQNYDKNGVKGIVDLLPHMSQKAIDAIARAEYEKISSLNKVDIILLATMSIDLLGELALKEYEATDLTNISDTVLAFMSEEAVDELAKKEYEKNGLKGLNKFSWAMSESLLDELVLKDYEKNGMKNISGNILPFISEDIIDEFASKQIEASGSISSSMLPFVSSEVIDELARKQYDENGNISSSMLPFVSDGLINELAKNKIETSGSISSSMLPFVSSEVIDELARKQYDENGNISSSMLPFVSDNVINEIAGKQIEASGNIPSGMLPFVSDKQIDEAAKKQYDKNGSISSSMLLFVSQKVIDELVRKDYEKNGLKNLSSDILVFMSEKVIDEIAKKEYDKTGLTNMSSFVWIMSDKLIEELDIDLSYGSPRSVGINQGWFTYYPGNKNSNSKVIVYEFNAVGMIVTVPKTNNDTSISNQYSMNGNGNDYIKFHGTCIIECKNGVKIETPRDTEVRNKNGIYTITIGNGDATIIKPDGTTSELSKGTVLDNKGNIVK